MKILVGYATDHGSTKGIAERIAARLRQRGPDVTLAKMVDINNLEQFDATILGSAIHSNNWLPEAEQYIDRQATALADRPTWLYSVSSLGDSNSFFPGPVGRFMATRRKDNESLVRWRSQFAKGRHRHFTGAVERGHWPGIGGFFLRAFGGSYGDHRDWADIEAWADSIGETLEQVSVEDNGRDGWI